MLLLVTCNMPMYTICNFVCTCMFFSKNKITTKNPNTLVSCIKYNLKPVLFHKQRDMPLSLFPILFTCF